MPVDLVSSLVGWAVSAAAVTTRILPRDIGSFTGRHGECGG